MLRRKTSYILLFLAVIGFTALLFSQWSVLEDVDALEDYHYKRIKTFAESLSLVKKNYVEKVVMTVVAIDKIDIEKTRRTVEDKIGVEFRIRPHF